VTVTSNQVRAKGPARAETAEAEAEYERLFLEYYPRVYGVLFRLLGDRAEAEDLTVETFWRLYRRPPRDARNLGGWLYRVALNLGLNSLRSAKRRGRYEQDAWQADNAGGAGPSPEEAVTAREERVRVRRVLQQVAPRQAQLLVLRHSGLTYQEIAEAAGVAPGSVGTLLARAEREFERRYRQAAEAEA
jgi:RNA polymerase sigma-70 factor (ECF subfamily)